MKKAPIAKPTMLDKVVSYFSPKAGLQREIAKQKLAKLRAQGAVATDARRNSSQNSNDNAASATELVFFLSVRANALYLGSANCLCSRRK
jgi:hypothetical protein